MKHCAAELIQTVPRFALLSPHERLKSIRRVKCEADRLYITLFLPISTLLLTALTVELVLYSVCTIKNAIYTHGCVQRAPTKSVHVTRLVYGKCACMCKCVHCRGYVSSAPVAPGEIYEVLRMLASSPVMGDGSHRLACLCPRLTQRLAPT